MKKYISMIVLSIMLMLLFCGCGKKVDGISIQFKGIQWYSNNEKVLSSIRKVFENNDIIEIEVGNGSDYKYIDDSNNYIGSLYNKYELNSFVCSYGKNESGENVLFSITYKTGSDYTKEDCVKLADTIYKELGNKNIERKVSSNDERFYSERMMEKDKDNNVIGIVTISFSDVEEEKICVTYQNFELFKKLAQKGN